MYIPKSFAVEELPVLHEVMQKHNFATLVTGGASLIATHLPFMIDTSRGEYGTLIAHMARANSHWKALEAAEEVMVIFQGEHSYISPNWYASHQVIATWNYVAIHAYGKAQLIQDAEGLKAMLRRLVAYHEPIEHLEEGFTDDRLKSIVGLEIPIARLEGKFKMSQNKSLDDQKRVVDILSQSNDPMQRAVASIIAGNLEALAHKIEQH